ncbi:MAG: spermidine synthase [Myxococcota bacterium]|nr:spermidine synthase [Myxococcota bacterium]
MGFPSGIGTVKLTYADVDRDDTALGELTLRRYTAETGEVGYEIRLGGNFLMATHGAHSERAMAEMALERLRGPATELQVLVGGLGAGHTLRAALDLPGVAGVVVAEIGARMVEWNRRYFADVNGGGVDDPRVDVRVADLHDLLRSSPRAFDLLLLDVDNGPGWLAAEGNAALYEEDGVRDCLAALRPGGVMAVWSPGPNERFRATLARVFDELEAVDTTAIGRKLGEPGDVIYLAPSPDRRRDGVCCPP